MAKKSDKKGGSTLAPTKKKIVLSAVEKVKSQKRAAAMNAAELKKDKLLFNKTNYMYMAIGVGLIFLGMIMMMGGSQPDPNTWDPDIIYSKRILILGPVLILAGLIVEIYAIFKK